MATMHKQHPTCGDNMLPARSMLHTARPLISKELTKNEKEVAKKRAQILALERKEPQRIKGRHMFVREAFVRGQAAGKLGQGMMKCIMKLHGTMFKELSRAQRDAYEARAQVEVLQQQEDVRTKVHTKRLEIKNLQLAKEEAGASIAGTP
jgi:hypothetical protein